jgi:hypothetical protein
MSTHLQASPTLWLSQDCKTASLARTRDSIKSKRDGRFKQGTSREIIPQDSFSSRVGASSDAVLGDRDSGKQGFIKAGDGESAARDRIGDW